jgi:hypothetical protein
MKTNEYKCYQCGNIFQSEQTEEEALKELDEQFGEGFLPEDCEVICDDCYNKISQHNKNRIKEIFQVPTEEKK